MYTPNTIQTTLTSRKYLTRSSKSYLQDHKGLGGTKKQMEESNKTGFLPPTIKPTAVTYKVNDDPTANAHCRTNRL
jgi:hypothetical protein